MKLEVILPMFFMPEDKKIKWIADKKIMIAGKKKIIRFYEYIVDKVKNDQQQQSRNK